ncbi:hypothetical protein CDIK_4408 [Cucumispora dikerogammari]|nr:hypothetical protein CDIK_4408 [Cucumispora dikerogammari]
MLFEKFRSIICADKTDQSNYDKRQAALKVSICNLNPELKNIQQKRVFMEEQFEEKFKYLVNEKFLEIEKEGEIEVDKFTEAVDLDTRPNFFDDINDVLQELFFSELLLFCYEYFSEIKHMILKSEKSVLEKCTSFFQRDLKILNEITHYKHTFNYSDFIRIKNFGSHFCIFYIVLNKLF